jgi:hypothetical protein
MTNVFTPHDSVTGKRLRFPRSKVIVLLGDLDVRKPGIKAYIEIHHGKDKTGWKRYEVHGENCGLPRCYCDAVIREVKNV